MKKKYKNPTLTVVMLQQTSMLMTSNVQQTSSNLSEQEAISVDPSPGTGQGRSRQSAFGDWDEE